MLQRYFIFLFFLLSFSKLKAQDSIPHLKVSLLTCAPGEDLYSIFGHTAIRVIDSTNKTDVIFNYGTFDFNDPNFYTKFVQGKLDYFVSIDEPSQFFYNYQTENRSVFEQTLLLNTATKKEIYNFLLRNIEPQNKFYKYDFLYNNCTTKIRDILKKETPITFNKNVVNANTTFRNALHIYLNKSNSYWNKLGIDILLGSKIDRKMSDEEANFLPELLMKNLASKQTYSVEKNEIVKTVFQKNESPTLTPNILFWVLCVGFFLLYFSNSIFAIKIFNTLSVTLVLVSGLIGVVLLVMWLATNHGSCANNYNLIWALPTNTFFAFTLLKKRKWSLQYLRIAFFIQIISLIFWIWLPQQMNVSLVPIVLILSLTYYHFSGLKKLKLFSKNYSSK